MEQENLPPQPPSLAPDEEAAALALQAMQASVAHCQPERGDYDNGEAEHHAFEAQAAQPEVHHPVVTQAEMSHPAVAQSGANEAEQSDSRGVSKVSCARRQ